MAADIIALLIIGALGGSAAAAITGRRKSKSTPDWLYKTGLGIIGAVVGSLLFDLLDWVPPDILNKPITAAQILTAFVGALVVIFVAGFVKR